jgi:hypothetical protein
MAKKAKEPEYVLRIFRHKDERTNKKSIVFTVETVNVFTNFKYEVLLEENLSGKELTLKILGLHAPAMLMPGKGPAIGRREFVGLRGAYTVHVSKMGKEFNDFLVDISSKEISIKDDPDKSFIVARIDPPEITKV